MPDLVTSAPGHAPARPATLLVPRDLLVEPWA